MERHFIIPITIAAALHAGLLFGFHGNAADPVPGRVKTRPPHGPDLPPIELPPPELQLETDRSTRAESSASETPISLEDGPVPRRENDFPISLPRPDPATRITTTLIPVGPPGISTDIGEGGGPRILSPKDLDGAPRARVQARPNYPIEARRSGLAGEVLVEFTVDETGVVLDPRAIRSSDRVFEEAAVRAVARWRFEPGLRGGRPVRFRMAVPIVFSIDKG